MDPVPFLVAGERVRGDAGTFASVNPATGALNYEVSAAGPRDVERCVAAAQEAARAPAWRRMRPHERARILAGIADGMTRRAERLAEIQMRENGKVMAECRAQVASAAATFRYYAGVCETLGSDVTPPRGDYLSLTMYEPVGVVAAITPWNSPLTMEAQKVAPALAAGNAVIVKPSEVTPTAAIEVAAIALEAGLPPGLLNVLTGTGRDTGMPLVRHPGVRMISFTGGTETGRAIAKLAAERLIPVALELGGKSPNIVFGDADLEAAVDGVIGGIFEGSGQSCVAGSRLFVQREVADRVLSLLKERTAALRVGMPTDPASQMGPLASFPHRERVEGYVASAIGEGGEILVGGRRPNGGALDGGAYYLPTVITGLSNSARACREEIFGPVLCVLPFDDEDDLIEQANDSAYGLACGIWTADYRRALRVAGAVEAGTVWVNTYKQLSISTPFGGFKDSGIGREKGISGMRLYQQAKSIYLGLGGGPAAAGRH
ncbi:aldehyde dehydrogenase [Enterovirga aerilata]|uniref:Aldehyde dehydrogenase n=1 Tax=Enterovirga aerilata TaxID=2730920 RepID=A0A849IAJ6_9HYPH|nr:aldehyde dehydrogenase [Enterovirga sp. DB1703]NNM74914.1 aldehyde dehydrogenase [Enterovirga sp. DB1703]